MVCKGRVEKGVRVLGFKGIRVIRERGRGKGEGRGEG